MNKDTKKTFKFLKLLILSVFLLISIVPSTKASADTLKPVYRFWNGTDHFYSLDRYEGTRAGYSYEGILGYAATSNTYNTLPVYRFWNGTEHFYSLDRYEGTRAGYKSEGIAFYAPKNMTNNGAMPVFRMYNGTDHFYTMDRDEAKSALTLGWWSENVSFYLF